MDKLNPGLAQHPVVKRELQKQNEQFKELEELKRSTLASYTGKAADQMAHAAIDKSSGATMGTMGRMSDMPDLAKKGSDKEDKAFQTILKRTKGITTASRRLAKEEVEIDEGKYGGFRVGPKKPRYPYVPQGDKDPSTGLPLGFSPIKPEPKESEPKKTKNEDVKLNELSRETMGSYVNKASDARGHKNLSTAKVDKRMSGIAKASSRLDKMDEEDELEEMSDAQMKRREDIAKSMNDADFKRRYGKDWMQVKMATATKMAQKEERELGEQEKKLFPGTPEYKKKFDPSYNPYDPQGKEKARLKLSPYGYRDRDDKKKKEVDELREPDEKKKRAAYTNLNHPDMEYHKGINIHNCATKVYSEQWGEGMPIKTMHAEPDADGNIAWYDIMFDHGIEKQVSITEMKIVASEMHYHKKNK
jgi:hypothetical protein